MGVVLPTEPKPRPEPTIEGDSFLVIGAPKQGKSHLVSTWPGCLVIDTQRGHRKYGGLVLDVLEVADEKGMTPLDVLRDVIVQLSKDCPYQAVALDVIDDVSTWFEAMTVAHLNRVHDLTGDRAYNSIADAAYGAGYTDHRYRVVRMVRAVLALPCTKILVAHSRNLIDEELGRRSKVMDLPGRLANQIPGEVDHVAVASHEEDRGFVLDFDGYEYKTGTGSMVEHSGSRLAELRGKTVANSYEAIVAAVREGPK